MPEVSLNDWKEYLNGHASAHLLQTAEWGELKAAFGWEPVRLICEGAGAQILFRKLPLGWTLAYMPKPPFMGQASAVGASFWAEVASICRRKHAILVKVELDNWERREPQKTAISALQTPRGLMFQQSAYNIQPPRTVVVDLRGNEDEILGRMKQKCRYNIRLAEKKGVRIRAWGDIDGFYEMIKITGGRDGFGVHSADYYRRAYQLFHPNGKCELLVAEYQDIPLAALMIFSHGPRSWYLYGASNDLARNRMPTYLLQWEAIRWSKARGCDEYDLWGVPDESEEVLESNFETRHDGLWGVYRFKRGFGGELRRAAQAIDHVFNPVLFQLYRWRMMAGRGST